ncbi:MAG: lipopolysaccharide core heptose(I) kinase RfaP [Gammaproteobacteria bacterium]|nr:lipopolysaccharide core heptose(I) kinase RfaP [Pseudomonadales bacterium]MCP5347584.1 lipopolysaccharide core heptose(I) kinase RfaP [Pseudomonadales bacterium]
MLYLDEQLTRAWQGQDPFALVSSLDGQVYRQVKGRRTLRFVLHNRGYFLKLHLGVGWREIFKNLLQLRLPVIGATNEWRAIRRLHELGIDTLTLAGYGRRGWNPASLQSFLITRELQDTMDLEAYCADWNHQPPAFTVKKALIEQVATISRRMHAAGICHRDYYLCHFHLHVEPTPAASGAPPDLFLIDLHRALFGKGRNSRWVKKDIAGLLFSSMEIGLTRRDRLRFARVYRNSSLRETLAHDRRFWRDVLHRGEALYKKLGNPRRTDQ